MWLVRLRLVWRRIGVGAPGGYVCRGARGSLIAILIAAAVGGDVAPVVGRALVAVLVEGGAGRIVDRAPTRLVALATPLAPLRAAASPGAAITYAVLGRVPGVVAGVIGVAVARVAIPAARQVPSPPVPIIARYVTVALLRAAVTLVRPPALAIVV
ncbi:hypothetical protein D3C71_1561990 [compost metagenome]